MEVDIHIEVFLFLFEIVLLRQIIPYHIIIITFERNFQSMGSSSKSVALNCNRGSIQLCR